MAYPDIITEQMYTTLVSAIMTGTREVYYGDKRVVYRSLDEMIRIKNMAAIALGLAEPLQGRKTATFNDDLHRDSSNCGSDGW